jgi:hypothetical protein
VISAIEVADRPPIVKISASPMSRPSWCRVNHAVAWSALYHGWPGGWTRVNRKKTTAYRL